MPNTMMDSPMIKVIGDIDLLRSMANNEKLIQYLEVKIDWKQDNDE